MAVLLCALLAWSATALVPARPRALRLDPRAAALVESAGLVPAGAVHVSEDLAAKTQTFDVELAAPLGLTLGESVVDGASRVHVRSVDASGSARRRRSSRRGRCAWRSPWA